MTNFEKWKDTILAITSNSDSVAVEDGVPCYCDDLDCKKCDLHGACNRKRYEWLYAEYVEPEVDWSRVPIDTKILVRDFDSSDWVRGYYAGVSDGGYVLTFNSGATSWSADTTRVVGWKYAKLADEEEEERKN